MVWILVALAFVVRAAVVLVVFEDRAYFSDERNYFAEAERLAAGNWLGESTHAAPGVRYFMAVGMKLGLDRTGLRLAQALLGALAVALTYGLARRLFGGPAALLAGAVMAVYPLLLYITGVFYAQNAAIPLLLLVLVALYRRQAGGGLGWLALAGLGWGLGIQFMVPLALTAPPLALWHWFRMPTRGRGFRDAVILGGLTVLLLVPVTIRNYVLEDKFVFVAGMGGRALYWANNPDVDPRDRDPDRWIEINITRVEAERERRGWTHAQVDSALTARAKQAIRRDPVWFLGNALERARQMWEPAPRPFTRNEHTSRSRRLVAAVSAGPAILLGLLGAVLFLRRFRELFPLYAVPLVLTAGFSAFHTTVRYRLTFEPIILIFAAAALVALVHRFTGNRVVDPPRTRLPEAP